MVITVDDLITSPFSNRSREEKIRIVSEGKPQPCFMNMSSSDTEKEMLLTVFNDSTYSDIQWITGCEIRQALFCWPCLLFIVQKSPWNTCGILDFSSLTEDIKYHERTINHIQGMLDWQMFLQTKITVPKEVPPPNKDFVKRNREIARRIIDVVCLQVAQQRPPPKGTNDKNQLKVEDCLENLQFLRDYDILYVSHIDEAIDMLQNNPSIVNDMVEAITCVAKLAVKNEIRRSTFASIILSGHSTDDTKLQISTVLRYIKDGKVVERFISFTTISGSKSSDMLLKHIDKVVAEFGIEGSFIALACDGSVLSKKDHLNDFIQKLKAAYPCSFFTTCYFHYVDCVLRQGLCVIEECDFFFKNLKAIETFFEKGSKKRQNFDLFKLPIACAFDCTDYYEFLRNIKIFRRHFVDFFDNIVKNIENWRADDYAKALAFQLFLKDIKTIFMLETFFKLFDHTTTLGKALRSHKPEVAFEGGIVCSLLDLLKNEKQNGFGIIFSLTLSENHNPKDIVKKEVPDETKQMCWDIFHKIMDCLISQVEIRYDPLSKLEFFHILNFEKHKKFVMTYDHVLKLAEIPKSIFNESQMSNEIKMLNKNGDIFNGKSVYQLFEFIRQANLQGSFENLFKLAKFILSMPCKPPSENGISSKFQDIMTWAYTPCKKVSGDFSMFCIEKDIMDEIRLTPSFHDDVMRYFYERNKIMDLMQ